MVILWDESLANFSSLVRVDQLVLSFAIVFHFFLSYYSGLPPLFREALVHMCNYRVHIWSELFPSPRVKRLAMGSALVSYCRSFMHELGLWLSGRLEHRGVCEPFGFSSPYQYVCWLYLSSASAKHEIFMSPLLSPSAFLNLLFWRKEHRHVSSSISASSKVYVAH